MVSDLLLARTIVHRDHPRYRWHIQLVGDVATVYYHDSGTCWRVDLDTLNNSIRRGIWIYLDSQLPTI